MIIARPATATRGFDCSAKPTRAQLQQLWALGYRWVGRYVPLPGVQSRGDIDDRELEMELSIGFEVSLVQHTRFPGWDPGTRSGVVDGMQAATSATAAGYPMGSHLFLDLEGVGGTAEDTARFAETWALSVVKSGFRAGVYCGYDDPLGPERLWLLHNVDCYWSDAGHRLVANRGCAIHQGIERVVAGLEIDEDTIEADLLGGLPVVAAWQSEIVAA